MKRLIWFAAIALLTGPAAAAVDQPDFDAFANATTCRAWADMRGAPRDAARTQLQAWLTRTVTADWNAPIAPDSDAGLDYAGIFGMVDVFCNAYPDKTMKDVTAMLIEEMDSR